MKSDEIKSKYDFKSIAEKSFKTKLKHGTTNTSKPERDLLNFLIDKFGKDGIEYQYKSQLYPYRCDFYIKGWIYM